MILLALLAVAAPEPIQPVSDELRGKLGLSPHYTKLVSAQTFPILGSNKVADAALREVKHLVETVTINHPEYLVALANAKIRFAVMAPSELTTDIPEHSDLAPKDYWDRRARGLGATRARPAVSCGEENALSEPGDPYFAESICIHEFAHTLHEHALTAVLPDFEKRLIAAFENARNKGIWRGTYAMTNEKEYWAEAVQSWFDTNRIEDHDHGLIDTREEVQGEDPMIAKLISDVLGDVPWRYRRISERPEKERAHLGALPEPLPRFTWPESIAAPVPQQLTELAAKTLTLNRDVQHIPLSPATNVGTLLVVKNAGGKMIELSWVDFQGKLTKYSSIPPGESVAQPTYAGHVWVISQNGRKIGWLAAPESSGELTVR